MVVLLRKFFLAAALTGLALLAGCSTGAAPTNAPQAVPTQAPEKPAEGTPGLQVTLHVMPTHPQTTPGLIATPDLSATPLPNDNTPTPTLGGRVDVTLPQPNSANWVEWVSGLSLPVDIAFLPNLPGTAYILQQEGRIAVAENGSMRAEPLLDLTGTAVRGGNEQGLLGIALDPAFAENRYFYLNYTNRGGDTIIARYQAGPDFLIADPGSAKTLLKVNQPYANHNGGALEFGPDGYLYIALGDGGSANDPRGNGQNLDSLLGKILRIDVTGDPYTIPADNPYASSGGRPEIWASGLRNPWKIAFDPVRGDLFIADVGQGSYEEINVYPYAAPGGFNFGWDYREGLHQFEGTPPEGLVLAEPVAEYSHAEGGCSVTGGYVYRGSALPDWQGVYLYADYCTGFIWGLAPQGETWQTVKLFSTDFITSGFGQDTAGEIYLLDHQAGRVMKLVP